MQEHTGQRNTYINHIIVYYNIITTKTQRLEKNPTYNGMTKIRKKEEQMTDSSIQNTKQPRKVIAMQNQSPKLNYGVNTSCFPLSRFCSACGTCRDVHACLNSVLSLINKNCMIIEVS